MTGDEGKQVTGSLQYCAINKSPCGQASMTGDEGNWLQVQRSIVLQNNLPVGRAA